MARRVTHIFQIIMLAACPHTFLRCHRPLIVAAFQTREQVLELNHTRIGKHQSRVILRNKRAGIDDLMPIRFKII